MKGVSVLHRSDKRSHQDDLDLDQKRYGIGVSWTTLNGRAIDIDLQCVVVSNEGVIIDCAYYNNLKAVRAITHSGDSSVGKPNHIEEMVWANFNRMPEHVHLLIFVVAAFSGGLLQDVKDGRVHVMEETDSQEIALIEMERSSGSVDVVAVMHRSERGWKLRIIDLPATTGHTFMDALPLLCQVVRDFIPSAPAKQKVAFALEKGGALDLPTDLDTIVVGLGWDVDEGLVDLDVSAVLLDEKGRDLEAVFFGRLESKEHGITHTGDNLTGEGEGDDEQVIVNLQKVGAKVDQIVFVVNIYTPNMTFLQVANPFCRVINSETGAELCRYSLREAGQQNGLIISRVGREAGVRWSFQALGVTCRGRTFKDSLPEVRAICKCRTSTLCENLGPTLYEDRHHVIPAKPAREQPVVKSSTCSVL